MPDFRQAFFSSHAAHVSCDKPRPGDLYCITSALTSVPGQGLNWLCCSWSSQHAANHALQGTVTAAEADVNTVLDSSGCLNTAKASRGKGTWDAVVLSLYLSMAFSLRSLSWRDGENSRAFFVYLWAWSSPVEVPWKCGACMYVSPCPLVIWPLLHGRQQAAGWAALAAACGSGARLLGLRLPGGRFARRVCREAESAAVSGSVWYHPSLDVAKWV